jgi:pimeloyl-ACP methyl ester carboxylesterase
LTSPEIAEPKERPSRRRRASVIGAVVGVAAAGVAAGVAAERLILRRARMSTTELANEPFGRLPFDESLTVRTADGLDIYVEIVEPADGVDLSFSFAPRGVPLPVEPTLVFVHGFCLDMGTFHFQRREFSRAGDYRMVFYDQPGHGRSSRIVTGEYSIEMLARTLKTVLDETVPTGPVVLVGHSMGGRTALYASTDPSVVGVCALAPWIEPADPIEHLAGKVLVVAHGDRDQMTDPAAARRYAARAGALGATVASFDVIGDAHAMMRRREDWHRIARDAVIAALDLDVPTTQLADVLAGPPAQRLGVPLAAVTVPSGGPDPARSVA